MTPEQILLSFLINKRLVPHSVTPDEITTKHAGPLRILASHGRCKQDDVLRQLEKDLGFEYVALSNLNASAKRRIPPLLAKIPGDLCRTHRLIPLVELDASIDVAFSNPFDYDAVKILEFIFNKAITIKLAQEEEIQALINRFQFSEKFELDLMLDTELDESIEIVGELSFGENIDTTAADAPPIIKLANKIIDDAVVAKASDIHVEPGQGGVDIRYRIDGVMQHVFEAPRRFASALITRLKLLASLDIAEHRRTQDGRMRVKVDGQAIDVRVSTVPTAHGEKIVLRLLRSNFEEMDFATLSLPTELESAIKEDLSQYGKLMLVTGPTGSGKTTALYTFLNHLRDGTTNIETVEDPIEYKIPGISQIQVNEAAQLTFASALRSILRQDPDIILLGEIRDHETADIALQAADTGHLVLSTLHTNTAASAISRLLSLGISPHSIASGVSAILAQRLVRRLCSHCKRRASGVLSEELEELLAQYQIELKDLCVAEGCEACRYTGYSGRLGLYSYLRITPAIRRLICSAATLDEITDQALKDGFVPLELYAAKLLREGSSSLEELRPYLVRQKPSSSEYCEGESNNGAQLDISTRGGEKGRILVVEDDENTRISLMALLRTSGHEVLGVENGLEGIRKINDFAPTLIVSGLGMPFMDGRQLLSAVRSLKDFDDIPFIVYTGSDSESTELELLGLGVSDFISKTRGVRVVVERIGQELRKNQ